MKTKSLVFVAVLATAVLCFAPFGPSASAQTTDNSVTIAQLQAQIASLMAQIQALQAQQGTTAAWCHTFTTSLGYANSGTAEVGYLHTALDKEGISYGTDAGNVYSEGTMSAIVDFQEKYGSEILTPSGLTHGTGYVGPSTRAKLNALYGCAVTPPPTPVDRSAITKSLMQNYLEPYKSQGVDLNKRIKDYSLNTVYVEVAKDNCFSSTVDFSVDTYKSQSNNGTYWTAGNGTEDGDWVRNKSLVINAVKDGTGNYTMKLVGTARIGDDCTTGSAVVPPVSAQPSTVTAYTVPTLTSTSDATVSAELYYATEDKVGAWGQFSANAGNGNKNPSDWHWQTKLEMPVQKTISRITIIHNLRGEVWSTGNSRYLADGTDLYGYAEQPYPLVVTRDGTQVNTAYNQNILTGSGLITLKLYGQPESSKFIGGQIVVEFTDGTRTVGVIPASTITQYQQAITTQPSIVLAPLTNATLTRGALNEVLKYRIAAPSSANYAVTAEPISFATQGVTLGTVQLYAESVLVATQTASADTSFTISLAPTSPYVIAAGNTTTFTVKATVSGLSGNPAALAVKRDGTDWQHTTGVGTTQPSITVTSPNGGETWVVGSTHNITWDAANWGSQATLTIDLVNPVGPDWNWPRATITSNVLASSGSYPWTIPSSIVGSSQYKIAIHSNAGMPIEDFSDNSFSIVAPTTTQPSGSLSVTPSATSISSGGSMTLSFKTHSNAVSSALYLSCPTGVSATWAGDIGGNTSLCNKMTKFNSPTVGSITFRVDNTTSAAQNLVPNFYEYLPDNPSYAVGVSSQVTVQPTTTQPSITVTSPNGGETWKIGETHNVTWTAPATTQNVDIYFDSTATHPGGGLVGGDLPNVHMSIASGLSSGSYQIVVPNVPVGTYKVLIQGSYDSAAHQYLGDFSDTPFSIVAPTTTQPSIKVISPTGGELMYAGQSYQISWRTTSNFNVKIELINTANNSVRTLSSSVQGDVTNGIDRSYSLPIPADVAAGTTYKLRLTDVDNSAVTAQSVGVFTIVSAAQPIAANSVQDSSLASISAAIAAIAAQIQAMLNK